MVQGTLPPNLKKLYISDHYRYRLEQNVLPDTLEHLTIYCECIDVGALPDSLRYLKMQELIESTLIPGVIPPYLIKMKYRILCINKKQLINIFPDSLKHLTLDNYQSMFQIRSYSFPKKLESLTFSSESFNQVLKGSWLPVSLQVLVIHNTNYPRKLLLDMPKSLKIIFRE